ncbi:MAG: hypothetical protein AB7U20_10015 [Planctomycetaceae bacterium]
MQESQESRSFSVRAAAIVAVGSACLTWLCVGSFGSQGPLTAAIAVILVELFLASFGVIAVLMAARISDTYLQIESRRPEQPRRSRRLWLWRPLWQPSLRWDTAEQPSPASLVPIEHWLRSVHAEMQPLDAAIDPPETVAFQPRSATLSTRPRSQSTGTPAHRRAA